MLRCLITIALFAHGIGHLLFLTNSWGIWKGGDEGRSWLFSGMLGAGQTVEGIFGLLWLIPLVGFVGVSWGYLTHQGWWPQLALASAAISLTMIVGWSRCGERLLRACVRSGRHLRGALATALGGAYLMRGDGV
jgi:hypothetical protein